MDNYERIEELYEIIRNDPTNFQAIRELSVELLDSGNNEEALKQLVYLIGIFPEDSRLYFNAGYTFERLKLFDKAEYSYRKAIEIDSNVADYYYNLGYLLMQQKKGVKEAVNCFKKVLELEPNDANTFFNLGVIYLKGNSYEIAIKCFKKSYLLNNFDLLSLFYQANAYQMLEKYDEAKNLYKELLIKSPEYSWAYFNLAQIAWKENDNEGAIVNLKKTLEINPKDIEASKILAQIYIRSKEYDNARQIINDALENNPYNGDLYYYLSKTYPEDIDRQIDSLKKSLENHKTLTIDAKQVKRELKEKRF